MTENKVVPKLTGDALIKSLLAKVDPADYKRTATQMRVAGVITDRMEEHKLGKTKLAGMLSVQPSVITKWLSGTHNFTIGTLSDISSVLDIPMSEFFTEREEPIVALTRFEVKSENPAHLFESFLASASESLTKQLVFDPLTPMRVSCVSRTLESLRGAMIVEAPETDHHEFSVTSNEIGVALKKIGDYRSKHLHKV